MESEKQSRMNQMSRTLNYRPTSESKGKTNPNILKEEE
jgi:hypothetical protein